MHKIASPTLRLLRVLSALQVVAVVAIGVVLAVHNDWSVALVSMAIALAAVACVLLAVWMRHREEKRTGMACSKVH